MSAEKHTSEVNMLEDLSTQYLVTENEVEAALEQCNFKKGIGPDGFDGRIFEKDKAIKELIVKEITLHEQWPHSRTP